MDEIYFKNDESTEDKSNDKHTYLVYLTNGKVIVVKATDYSNLEDDDKFVEFYDGNYIVANIKADLIYSICDREYASEDSCYTMRYSLT